MSEWEVVTTATFTTWRLSVPGGWIYKVGEALIFVAGRQEPVTPVGPKSALFNVPYVSQRTYRSGELDA